jgi:hypothetical protein
VRILFLLLASAAVALAPPQGPAPVDLSSVGPRVGEVAADFELPDQDGRPRRLSSLAGPKGTMLVFYRSADW